MAKGLEMVRLPLLDTFRTFLLGWIYRRITKHL